MWSTFGASQQGGTHIQMNLPCQDASLCREGKGYSIAAVADGHGSRKHFRSGKGSELACMVACDCMEALLEHIKPKKAPTEEEIQLLKGQIYLNWQHVVKLDVEQNPWTAEELKEQAALLKPEEYENLMGRANVWLPYGTTILTILVTENFWLAVQLGDGDMLTFSPKGDITWPMPESNVNQGHFTASLCMSDPMPEFRHYISESFPAAFLLYTDGIEKAFPARGRQLSEFLYAIWKVVYAGKLSEVEKALTAVAHLSPVKDDATIAGIIDCQVSIEKPAFEEMKRLEQIARIEAQISEVVSTMEYNQSCLQRLECRTADDQFAAMEMEQIILQCAQQIEQLKNQTKQLMQNEHNAETTGTIHTAKDANIHCDDRIPEPQNTTSTDEACEEEEETATLFLHDDPQLTWTLPPKKEDGEVSDPDNI